MKQLKVDLYDEHYYRDEQWFLTHGLRYDSYDRKGPKVFAGEYACHGKGKKTVAVPHLPHEEVVYI